MNAGTYVAAVTVTYEGGAKATTRVSFTVNKAQQDAPAAPEVLASASGWVILKEAAASSAGTAAQYSKDGGETWQANGVFVGLAEGETYAFAVRYAEDENHEASLASEITRIAAEDGGESVVCSRELAALLLWHAENCPEPTGEIVPADVEPKAGMPTRLRGPWKPVFSRTARTESSSRKNRLRGMCWKRRFSSLRCIAATTKPKSRCARSPGTPSFRRTMARMLRLR